MFALSNFKLKGINVARTSPTDVDHYMMTLEHPLKPEVELIRTIINEVDLEITEHVKWNAPSFCYGGDDRVTLNLSDQQSVRIILHRGARPRVSDGFAFKDHAGLTKWSTGDRGVVTFRNARDILAARASLKNLVRSWMIATAECPVIDSPST